jgi:hypothetical protein
MRLDFACHVGDWECLPGLVCAELHAGDGDGRYGWDAADSAA